MSTEKSKWAIGTRATSISGERPALNQLLDRGSEGSGIEPAGFSGTCENASLADWIQLVQMGRRDAVVSIRTYDGKMGRLWCRNGDIIDASCDGLVGADAVYRALSWEGGKVSVDFRTFERTRKIPGATGALLLEGAYRKDSGVRELGYAQGRSSSVPAPPLRSSSVPAPRSSSVPAPALRSSNVPAPALPLASAGAAWTPTPAPAAHGQRRVLGVVLACAAVLLLGLGVAVAGWVSPISRESTVKAAVSTFLVQVDVEPAHAEIALDGKAVAMGQLNRTMARDGNTHEIRFSAAGYASERLIFRDTPLRQRVVLTRSDDGQASERVATSQPARTPPTSKASSGWRSRAVLPQVKQPSTASHPAPIIEKAQEPPTAKVNVQIIEENRPRIQVIDEHKPRIEVIE